MPSIRRVPAAVLVVELGLGDRVVDVDRRELERAGLGHLVQPVHAGGGLLGDALDRLATALVHLPGSVGEGVAQPVEDDHATPRCRPRPGAGPRPPASYSAPLCTNRVASPPSSRIMFGASPSGQVSACSVHHQYSSSVSPFQAKTGMPLGSSGVPSGPTATAAAAWSWVEKMLQLAQRTCAPSATRVSIRTAVWIGHVQRAGDPGARAAAGIPRTRRGSPSGRASRARRAGSPCGRSRPGEMSATLYGSALMRSNSFIGWPLRPSAPWLTGGLCHRARPGCEGRPLECNCDRSRRYGIRRLPRTRDGGFLTDKC